MRRALLAAAATLLVFAVGDRPAIEVVRAQTVDSGRGAKSSSGSTESKPPCQCPTLPVVATNDKPSPGKAYGELTFSDLEMGFSTLEAQYNGDWDAAVLALEHQIDPGGQTKIWDKPAPVPANPKAAVSSGSFSEYLLHGMPPRSTPGPAPSRTVPSPRPAPAPPAPFRGGVGGPGRAGVVTPKVPVISPRPLTAPPPPPPVAFVGGGLSGNGFMQAAIVTIARANKYGEPTFGLRKATLRLARFVANDLYRIPDEAQAEPAAARALSIALVAHLPLTDALQAIVKPNPAREQSLLRMSKTWLGIPTDLSAMKMPPDALALDRYDYANAALDIMFSQDDKGVRDGLLDLTGPTGPGWRMRFDPLVNVMAIVAARRALFGGDAVAGSPDDVIACKTFTAMVALATQSGPRGKSFREALIRLLNSGAVASSDQVAQKFPERMSVTRAVRTAAVLGGIEDGQEAADLADRLWAMATFGLRGGVHPFGPPDLQRRTTSGDVFPIWHDLEMIRNYYQLAHGAGVTAFRQQFDSKFKELQQWVNQKKADEAKSGMKVSSMGADAQQDFIDTWNATKPDMDPKLLDPCKSDETPPDILIFVKTKFGLVLVKKFYAGVPLVIGVPFDEPYDKDSYTVTIDGMDFKATPYENDRKLYVTEAFEIRQ